MNKIANGIYEKSRDSGENYGNSSLKRLDIILI